KRRELLLAFNAGDAAARVAVTAAAPGPWQPVLGVSAALPAGNRVTLAVPARSAVVLVSSAPIPSVPAPAPVLKVGPDDLTSYLRASATVAGGAPVTVTFAVRSGNGSWRRLATDDSPPYRA